MSGDTARALLPLLAPKAAPIRPPHMGPLTGGAAAAHTRAVEVVGTAESGPRLPRSGRPAWVRLLGSTGLA
jgi:hypothetical protein